MADSIAGNNTYAGGLSFSTPALQLGATNGATINSGFNFDLPLATVAAFQNRALNFSAKNTSNARGFLSGVLGNTQGAVSDSVSQAYGFMNSSVAQLVAMNTQNQMAANYRTTVQSRQKVSGGGGCFITTAICEARGLPDDCEELEILREFRDTYMMATCKGRNLVRRYYEIAPPIAARLSYEQCEELRTKYLKPAITFIMVGDFKHAEQMYFSLVAAASQMTGV